MVVAWTPHFVWSKNAEFFQSKLLIHSHFFLGQNPHWCWLYLNISLIHSCWWVSPHIWWFHSHLIDIFSWFNHVGVCWSSTTSTNTTTSPRSLFLDLVAFLFNHPQYIKKWWKRKTNFYSLYHSLCIPVLNPQVLLVKVLSAEPRNRPLWISRKETKVLPLDALRRGRWLRMQIGSVDKWGVHWWKWEFEQWKLGQLGWNWININNLRIDLDRFGQGKVSF